MEIRDLIEKLRSTAGCEVFPPRGLPLIDEKVCLPDDLREFYDSCGGVRLFADKEHSFLISAPEELVPANPVIVGELCEDDISSKWYIICAASPNEYITIDLARERNGRCYDSFWDRHAVAGECAIVAGSFTELLERLYTNMGESLFWLDEDFEYIGDAYDE